MMVQLCRIYMLLVDPRFCRFIYLFIFDKCSAVLFIIIVQPILLPLLHYIF